MLKQLTNQSLHFQCLTLKISKRYQITSLYLPTKALVLCGILYSVFLCQSCHYISFDKRFNLPEIHFLNFIAGPNIFAMGQQDTVLMVHAKKKKKDEVRKAK